MKLFIIVLCLAFVSSASAQSFFRPLPKAGHGFISGKLALGGDSTMNAIRPIVNVAAFTIPGNILMTGAGISYQHLKWDAPSQKWTCVWSVSGLGWAGASLDPASQSNTSTMSYGIMLGFLNNLIMVGPAINNGKLFATVAIGVSLNN